MLEHEAVRKTVTVLFCDLVGSTPFAEQVDTESVRETLGRYHSMVQRMVDDRGGSVAKFIGDGVMAVFGVPEMAEDDAERTVATALELQRGFPAIRSMVEDRFGIDLGLRVGINTGEVIMSDDDSDLVGDVLNTAARLEAACTPGEVVVGEDTWRLTRSAIRYEDLGEIELRGKSGGVPAFRAIDEAATDDDSATPFVGRDPELRLLIDVIDEAVAVREVRLVTVIGAPGVGKTRLAEELERTYLGDATFIDIRIERSGGTTFSPVAELIRIAAGLDDARTSDEVSARIRAVVDGLDDADHVASLLASFVGVAEPRSTEELFFAVRRLLEAVGRTRPVVVVVDDIQWAEPLMLDLLDHVADWVDDAPAVILGLARPELRETRPALAERSRRVAETIALEGLDAEATAELAARLVGAAALPDDLLHRLPESTEGNPLFVRELMKMLVDDRVIVEGAQGWELAIDAEAIEVPPTIQSLLSSRIERLPGNERRMLERASVVGTDFPLGAVATLTPQGDAGRLIPIVERLRRKELVDATGSYWGNEPIFRFHHALIRDAAYRRLLKRTRADHHLTVVKWMEGAGRGVTGEHEVTIGYHLEQAHDLRMQLNISDDGTAEIGVRAAEALGAAAKRALGRDDVAAASSLAARAVELLDGDSPDLPDLLMLGCEAFFALDDVSAGVQLLKQLEDLTDDDERFASWAHALRAQQLTLTEPDRLVEAEAAAATAAGALAALDDRTGEANARLVRAGALARLGHIGECEAELDKALTAARAAGDGRRVATVLGAAPVAALWGPSPVPRASGRCLDVLRMLRVTTGSPRVEATATRCQAVLEALRGRFDTARDMLAEARASVEKLGDRHGLLETQLYWGIVELLAGDPEAAEPHLRAAYGGLGRLGIGADAGQAAAYLSRALLLQGRLEEAAELADDSEALAGQNPQTIIAAKTARADLLAATGDLEEAQRAADQAVAAAAGTDILIDHANANLALARVRSLAGDAEGTRNAVDAAQQLFTAKGASIDIDIEIPDSPGATSTSASNSNSTSNSTTAASVVASTERPAPQRNDEVWNRADALAGNQLEAVNDWPAARDSLHSEVEPDDRRTVVSSARPGVEATRTPPEAVDRLLVDALMNPASQLANRAHMCHRDGRWPLMSTSLAPDVHVVETDGELVAADRKPLLDPAAARLLGFGASHHRVLAIRGEHLALMEWAVVPHSEGADRRFVVIELDDRARLASMRLYEWTVDALTEATDHLEARWKETADLDDDDLLMIDAITAWRHGDQEVLGRILHTDFLAADHRSLSWGDYDRDEFIALFDGDARNVVVEVSARYIGSEGSGRAFHLTALGCQENELLEALEGHFVVVLRDGMVLRCDGYDVDTSEETHLRLCELLAELGKVSAGAEVDQSRFG